MKKFYLFLLTAIMALGVSFGASAQDNPEYSVTFTWDTPGSVAIKLKGSYVTIPDGATEYTAKANKSDWASAMVYGANGYIVNTCVSTDEKQTTVKRNGQGCCSVSINAANNGRTYKVNVEEIVKDKTFTLNIENGAKKIDYIEFPGSKETINSFENGSTPVKFSAALDNEINIMPVTGTEIFSVKRNGTAITKSYWGNYFTVGIADGDVITVRVYEGEEPAEQKCTYTIEGEAAALTNIFNKSTLKAITPENGKFTVDKGNLISLTFNADYTVSSLTLGGTPLEVAGNQASFTAESDATIAITAAAKQYGTKTYTAYVTYPEAVTIYSGNMLNGQIFDNLLDNPDVTVEDVPAGTALPAKADIAHTKKITVKISDKYGDFNANVKAGYWLRGIYNSSFKDADMPLTKPAVLYIVAEPIENDSKALIFYQGPADRVRIQSSGTYGADRKVYLTEGVQEFEFDHDYEAPFDIRNGAAIDNMAVVADGSVISKDDNGVFSGIALSDGSVLKIFADGKAHKASPVTFNVAKGLTPTVTYDRIKTHTDFAKALSCYDGTEITIATDPKHFLIADGKSIEGGNHSFTTTGAHEISVLAADPTVAIITPNPAEPTESLETITIAFPNATKVTRSDMAEDEIIFMSTDMNYAAISISVEQVADAEVPTFTLKFTPAPVAQKKYSLFIPEGFFKCNGLNNTEIDEIFTLKNNQTADIEYSVDPFGDIVAGDFMYGAFVFDESLMVEVSDPSAVYEKMTVKFNNEELTPGEYSIEASEFFFMVNIADSKYLNRAGQLTIHVEAGAFTLSGNASPELDHTWNVVAPKEYEIKITPVSGETVYDLSSVIIEFPNATSAELFASAWLYLQNDLVGEGAYRSTANITEVEGAEHPTFRATFLTEPTVKGKYTLTIGDGTFTLDGIQASPAAEAVYTLASDPSAIDGIEADGTEGGDFFTISGINAGSDWKALPAGIYVRNGKKYIKK